MNDSASEVSGRNEQHDGENIYHLRECLNCHEETVNKKMYTKGVAGITQMERRNMLLKTGEKGSMYTVAKS